ncbi:hypothetical protein FPOAC1_006011 [Fusarium poae]|uniref:hypothetical protein n=1 Tax=Fusarium poae TaxID=36050 RepID=UPI001CEB34D5|nr:hypothetical protein FPOAC1_006011 [Fusarium poae]KAG8672725.1 hypothetical protein FPOAC1_006011 [Fusarium poae]
MKYSTATVLILAQGIVAAPSLLSKLSRQNNKVVHQSSGEDITLSIKVSQSPMKGDLAHSMNYDICWLLCADHEITCPEKWSSKQLGDCWTCCYTPEEE